MMLFEMYWKQDSERLKIDYSSSFLFHVINLAEEHLMYHHVPLHCITVVR